MPPHELSDIIALAAVLNRVFSGHRGKGLFKGRVAQGRHPEDRELEPVFLRPIRQVQGGLRFAGAAKAENGGFPALLAQEQHRFESVQHPRPVQRSVGSRRVECSGKAWRHGLQQV